MPKMDCLGNCGKEVKNPPGKNVTGFCAVCLGLAHKKKVRIIETDDHIIIQEVK